MPASPNATRLPGRLELEQLAKYLVGIQYSVDRKIRQEQYKIEGNRAHTQVYFIGSLSTVHISSVYEES